MSQEDDLRGLARVMDFMRALSILFIIINIYWYCYPAIKEWGIDIGVKQDTAQFSTNSGIVHLFALHQTFLYSIPCFVLSWNQRGKRRKDKMDAYMDSTFYRLYPILF